MTKNAAIVIVAIILGLVILGWLLKLAFKLILIGIVVVGAIALFSAVTKRIGGPRA
ncbi:MAG TPA: hypothetical protein VGW40_09880 [Allosphingosinicella sp.]|nr:hypothetical protein [Allosphingosinicella sp.]